MSAGDGALDEFLEADIVVAGAPMYNFSIPSQLKAWLDRILVAGKTVRYTDQGVEGLVPEKRVIIAVSRGGLYGPDMPAAAAEHVETICAPCSALSASSRRLSLPKESRSGSSNATRP
jgi:FMN-dependent NADH-azoreductase